MIDDEGCQKLVKEKKSGEKEGKEKGMIKEWVSYIFINCQLSVCEIPR